MESLIILKQNISRSFMYQVINSKPSVKNLWCRNSGIVFSSSSTATNLDNKIPTESTSQNLDEAKDEDMPSFNLPNPYQKERKKCLFCKHNIKLDYKNPRMLSQFVSRFTGQVYGKHITGLCAQQQEKLEKVIALSRTAGYMAYEYKDMKYVNDPALFDPFIFPPKRY